MDPRDQWELMADGGSVWVRGWRVGVGGNVLRHLQTSKRPHLLPAPSHSISPRNHFLGIIEKTRDFSIL